MKCASEVRQVQCEQILIEYILTRKSVKNINLRIKPDGKIYVSASNLVPTDYIDDFIREKRDFIIRALEDYEERQKDSITLPKKYVDDEIFKLLGQSLKLKVIEDKKESVLSDDRYLYLRIKEENKDNVEYKRVLINNWLEELIIKTFKEACDEAYQVFKKYGVKYPNKISIRYMTSRWGSCRPKKRNITLNSRLIEAPIKSIEYVVFHEFAHFIHSNHSKDFYSLLEEVMPDWQVRNKEIKKL